MSSGRHKDDLESLYTTWAPQAYRRILTFFPEQEAEDVLHELFIKLFDRLESFRGEAGVATWLYRVTTNHCLNRLRDQKRRRELLAREAPRWSERVSPPTNDARLFLERLWRELPEELCAIGVYHHIDGMTHAEIAELLGVSRRTIGNRLRSLQERALALLQDRTEP